MRNFLLLSFLIGVLYVNVTAQIQSGTVIYNHTSSFDTKGMPPHMASSMPKSAVNSMELQFNSTQSLYQKNPNFKEEVNPNDNMPRFFKRMREMSVATFYKDMNNSQLLEQASFFGKDFLIEDSISNIKWKISAGEQKMIAGYTCMKAYYKDSTYNLVAFFTPQIPVSQGPDIYSGLPGLILEVQSADTHIIATEIKSGDVRIQKPGKGSKMTRKEFAKLKEDKIKEQSEMWGGQRSSNMRMPH